MMNLVHVVPHIDQEAAGPSYSIPRLCQALAALGHQVELSCLAARGPVEGVHLDLHPQWPVLRRLAVSPSLANALARKSRRVDIVHNHSLWSMVNMAAGWAVPGQHAKLVTSPRGTLAPWALGRTRRYKQAMWPLQRRVLDRADLLHATSTAELQDIRALGYRQPIAVIPNGIDIPPEFETGPDLSSGAMRTLLFLSRIHPTKGLDRLLQAWRSLQDDHPGWRLVIAGLGEPEHEAQVRNLARTLSTERVEFPGPLFGDAKSRAYQAADLFVLPTHTENFGMVVAEALAHSCPAVVSTGAPWQGLERTGSGWWVDNDVDSLARALDFAMRCEPKALKCMGARGRQWMNDEFSWETVARQMAATYDWLRHGGAAPSWVEVSA
ncbi:glycosyltransferase [Ideonella sp. DXS22W]|uniref:Glycosyltransferase n=1 Tax=Pseudaquabacterium inlustre TaxID=2984192 RepID=A0ABU9CDC4_9BURK